MTEGPIRIRQRRVRPAGDRILHEPFAETALAVRFRYYGWLLWIPRSALSHVSDAYTAPAWAIDTAKEHESAVHFSVEREAMDEVDEALTRFKPLPGSNLKIAQKTG